MNMNMHGMGQNPMAMQGMAAGGLSPAIMQASPQHPGNIMQTTIASTVGTNDELEENKMAPRVSTNKLKPKPFAAVNFKPPGPVLLSASLATKTSEAGSHTPSTPAFGNSNTTPWVPDLQVCQSDLWDELNKLEVPVAGTSSLPSKRARRKSPTRSNDIYKEVKIEVVSSDDDCEILEGLQGAEDVSSNKENRPGQTEQSLLDNFDVVEERSLSRGQPQFLVVRIRGEDHERARSKIAKNELKRKIAALRDENETLQDQEKINEEKKNLLLQRMQQLDENVANVALQKASNEAELNMYMSLLEEWERD